MCILEYTFGITFVFTFWLQCTYFRGDVHLEDHICIYILVAMHIFWRRCAFGGPHLHLHFGYNAQILKNVRAFKRSHLYLHFSCNAHLFWRRCIFKYNYIQIFIEEMTLIKYYCNPYHISSKIEENKTNFANWMYKSHRNSTT